MTETPPSLDLDEHLAFQRQEWRVQRVGRWLLVVFVLAACAGLFGSGPLSNAEAVAAGGHLRVEYARFIRRSASTRIAVHMGASAGTKREELRIDRRYFDGVRIQQITPAALTTHVGADVVSMTFDLPGPSTIVLDLEPLWAGSHPATFAAAGGSATFSQFAYF